MSVNMSRLDSDVVFYRVFCITLLVTAFTFTVIITNVFIDIDGLLSNKEKYSSEVSETPDTMTNEVHNSSPNEESKRIVSNEESRRVVSNEEENYDNDINPSYRTKRSIESKTGLQIKNPAVKKMLTSRLANLLKELDEETKKEEIPEVTTVKEFMAVTEENKDQAQVIRNDDLLHLAMHNILLQGLIGHMDLNEVYKKVHILVNNFNKNVNSKEKDDKGIKTLKDIINSKETSKESRYNEEHKFFEEIVKCKKLKDQIAQDKINGANTTSNSVIKTKDKLYIKALIEIFDNNQTLKVANKTKSDKNVEGFIELIYNGKSIKFNQMEEGPETKNLSQKNSSCFVEISPSRNIVINKNPDNIQKPMFDQVIEEYLKKHSLQNPGRLRDSEEIENIETHRLKRQIKIRYFDNITLSKTKLSDKIKKDDDDLYIEIETHFDGKGIKGEKKKKLVKDLINKIQKALHSDVQEKPDDVEHIKFVKRSQDPIISKRKATYLNTISPLLVPFEQRQLDPISKSLKNHENVADVRGETWKKQVFGPNFLSASKSVNSAEMGELNIDYDRVLKNGMSRRLQEPLNKEIEDEENNNRLLDTNKNNVTLFLKNIDGTGFSIGFNQYVGEPPDSESMKMFTGVENIIKEYHKTYDQGEISNESAIDKVNNFVEVDHGVEKRNVKNIHKILRRAVTQIGTDYHTNEYKIFLQKFILPLKKYSNLLNHANYKSKLNLKTKEIRDRNITIATRNSTIKELPIKINEKAVIKKLMPSETLSLNNILNRKKRSINIKKISSLKSKIKLNRYINTKQMANKNIFLKNKRNKRQVNKIRIIARDKSQALPLLNSDENIFLISKENSNTHKGTISGVQPPESIMDNKSQARDEEDYPFSNIYRIQNPRFQPVLSENFYNDNIRSNVLMSKYPHIFVNERSWAKEEDYVNSEIPYRMNVKPYRIQPTPDRNSFSKGVDMVTEVSKTVPQDADMPKVKEIVDAIMPPLSNTNYKVTLKVSPKNRTNIDAGFKEVHTTVNKSFNENGLRYFSLLNVSQISKVEKLNKTEIEDDEKDLDDQFKEQKNQFSALLRLHKNKVDVQLNTLLRESKHLEKLIESNKGNNETKTLILFPEDVLESDRTNDGISQNGSGPMKQLSDLTNNTSNFLTTKATLKHIEQLKTSTEMPKIDIDKIKLLDTIKRNEKITTEILKKIDTNTHVLRTFLQKFNEKFDSNKIINTPTTVKTPINNAIEVKLDLTKDWKVYGSKQHPYFLSNELKNDTIPFVYAYQQNIPLKNWTTPQGLASIVYHGHIHTNPVLHENRNELMKTANIQSNTNGNTDNNRRKFNESKFFIDDLDHFKVTQNNNPIIRANIKINTTAV